MPQSSTANKKFLYLFAFVALTAAAVVLSPGFRRWIRDSEIKKQAEVSGGAKNVVIHEDDDEAVKIKGVGSVER